jgi:hypothetical protein
MQSELCHGCKRYFKPLNMATDGFELYCWACFPTDGARPVYFLKKPYDRKHVVEWIDGPEGDEDNNKRYKRAMWKSMGCKPLLCKNEGCRGCWDFADTVVLLKTGLVFMCGGCLDDGSDEEELYYSIEKGQVQAFHVHT